MSAAKSVHVLLGKMVIVLSRNVIPGRAAEMPPFIVMEVLEKAQEMESAGKSIIHLEVGEPDFDTPTPIREAAVRAISSGDTHYTSSLGKIELREAIAAYYKSQYNVEVSPDRILITAGTSPGMLLVFSALMGRGDEIILPDPYYACYPNFIRYLDGQPVFVPVWEEDGFKYRPEEIRKSISTRTRGIMVNSPANPTGTVFTAHELGAMAELGQTIISDEIYHGLIYEGEEHSILEFTDQAFVINGFSKLFAMTGWRLGWVIAPPDYIRPMQRMQQNLFICAPSFAQSAATAAFTECDRYVADMVQAYDERRCYVLKRLSEMGIATSVAPTGAFYALANVKKYTHDSYAFAFEILEKAGVAVTPGIDFGPNCEGYLRFSYANSLENIKEGMDRIEKFLAK